MSDGLIIFGAIVLALSNVYQWLQWNQWHRNYIRMRNDRDRFAIKAEELKQANRELVHERMQWISENVALRNELAEWHAEAERRIVGSQEGKND